MMRGFRRAQLRGSDELFRPTNDETSPEADARGSTAAAPVAETVVSAVPSAPTPDSRSLRLTVEDITLLADALQKLKFPKPAGRPAVHEYERFEELRQKLLDSL